MTSPETVRALVRVARVLERAGGDLTLPHVRVLAAIADGDERASRVARRLALGKPTISSTVDALCRRGLLTRSDEDGDQRAVRLALTPAGRAALAAAEQSMQERLDELLAHTRAPAKVTAALAQLGPALDALADERWAARA